MSGDGEVLSETDVVGEELRRGRPAVSSGEEQCVDDDAGADEPALRRRRRRRRGG